MSQIVIGTAGHIDHGKTALVKALTGVDTDRLEEEKSRGMTIDLGFAFLNDNVTIIDVPGHEKFIRNMVAGVSTIHLALLVVAADDGIMPQTREHLQIISLLGIPKGVIALTKIDLADDPDWLDLVEEEIVETVRGTGLETAPIIRTSVNPETGIEELKQALIGKAEEVQLAYNRGFFRLPVDRIFVKTGFGLVATGTVISGKLSVGNELTCLPAGVQGKVRGLQSHGKKVNSVTMGDRAAINLVGVEKHQLWRGAELVSHGWLTPTDRLIANVQMVPETNWKLKSKQRIRVHLGTAEILGRVTIPGITLKKGQSTNLIIDLEKPLSGAMDDRFVIRSYSPLNTIGGGVILDPLPVGKWKEIRLWMQGLAKDRTERFRQFVDRFRNHPKAENEWAKIFHVSIPEIQVLVKENGLEIQNSLILNPEKLEEARNVLIKRLEKYHKKNPYRQSLNGEVIRKELDFSLKWFELVTGTLIDEGVLKSVEAGYALADHKISLSSDDQQKADLVSALLKKTQFMPLSLKEIEAETNIESNSVLELLHVLKGQGRLVEIQQGLWMRKDNLDKLISMLGTFFSSNKTLNVPTFKNMTSLTRKTAIPLLEYLDRRGITMRAGNDRIKGEIPI